MDQAKGVLKIYGRIRDTVNQGDSLIKLVFLLYDDGRIRYLRSKGRREEAIGHFETAIETATPPPLGRRTDHYSPSRFLAKTILMVHMLTSNEPSRTPSITRTSCAVACRRRVLST